MTVLSLACCVLQRSVRSSGYRGLVRVKMRGNAVAAFPDLRALADEGQDDDRRRGGLLRAASGLDRHAECVAAKYPGDHNGRGRSVAAGGQQASRAGMRRAYQPELVHL